MGGFQTRPYAGGSRTAPTTDNGVASTAGVAEQERMRREYARRRLIPFCWYTMREYQIARHNKLLGDYLEEVERYIDTGGREGIGRLMVFMPPRHGKSELVSIRFPAWFLGKHPDKRVILCSCTGDLAASFSRKVRNVVLDTPFQAVFGVTSSVEEPVRIAEDSRAATAWDLEGQAGGMVAAGVGGAIVGRGAHLAVIDDPFRNRNDAESKPVRDRTDEWYRSDLYSRLEEGGAIVLMHQRWHEDDLAGRLLKRMVEEEGADRWVVLNLAALAEGHGKGHGIEAAVPLRDGVSGADAGRGNVGGFQTRPYDGAKGEEDFGERVVRALKAGWWLGVDPLGRKAGEALWPEKYPAEALERIKHNVGGYEWDSMYQQHPRQLEGALIKAHRIMVIDASEVPEDVREARYWDLAVSARDSADYICGGRVARARDGRVIIRHIERTPGPWASAKPRMVEVMRGDPASVEQGIEISGQQGGYYQELKRDRRLQGRVIRAVNPQRVGSKEVRANVWASRIEDGLVYMVRAAWNEEFIAECLAFPRGAHDDQVDGVSGAVQMLGSLGREAESYQG